MFSDFDAIVLDLDGTLVDSAPDLAFALNHTLALADHPALSVSKVRNMIGGGVPKLLERGLMAHKADASEAVVEKLLPDMLEFYGANATRETYVYPGGEDLLRYLKSADIPTALCTNKPTEVTRIILADLGLAEYFDCVVGGTSGFPKKPNPQSLKYILNELGARPARTLMVGDSAVDVGSARNAGTVIAVMTYGYSKTPASQLGADFVLDDLGKLLELLQAGSRRSAKAAAPEA